MAILVAMKSLNLLALLLGVSALVLCSGCRSASHAARPNVIILITDDQGIGDFGVMGNPVIETPNLDALARSSASVSDFYVSPVCSPTRASLMTGRYHMRTQCIDTYLGRSMMAPEEVTLAEVLKDAGYATGIFGKWHLGDNHPMRPSDQGFDESLIHLGGGIGQWSDPREAPGKYTDPVLYHNNRRVQTEGYCTDVYTDAAVAFIREQAAAGKPFFAYIALNAPHGPYHDVPETLRQHYKDKDLTPIMAPNERGNADAVDRLERIAAMIGNIDDNTGRLMRALEAGGLMDDTIIVYLNDNGPNTRRYVGDMRGMKTEVFEGGVRSPLWVRWDGVLEPGHTAKQVAAHFDLMPTLLDACNVDAPEGVEFDGVSLLPQLRGAHVRPVRPGDERPVVIQAHRGTKPSRYNNFMLRQGDWKLLNSTRPWRVQVEKDPTFELYNIAEDPGEADNLAEKHPEKLAELKAAYDAWFDDVHNSFKARAFPQPIVIDPAHANPATLTLQDWSDGKWVTAVAVGGAYNIRLQTQINKKVQGEGWTAELRIGDKVHTQALSDGDTEIVFDAVDLPAGALEIAAMLRKQGERGASFGYVHISR